jgi:NAD(P)-dependent dehydrogenase (short-subunit alcohol dehydrogenase family)
MTLDGKVVVVTGARRIGAEIAAAVAVRGADVGVLYRSSIDEAREIETRVREAGRRAVLVSADVADAEQAHRAIATLEAELGRLDVLVNMASVYRQIAFDDLRVEQWRTQLSVDLDGTFHCSMAAVPMMRKQGGGRIINFTDWVAASGRPRYSGFLAYYVAKSGVRAFTEALALEVAADRILVNAIAPGPILAPPGTSDDELEAVVAATPLGRWGGPAEVVKAVLALIDTDFITGETIRVDGGRHLR